MKNSIKREQISNIVEEFHLKAKSVGWESIKKNECDECLKKVLAILQENNCEEDSRFFTFGRRSFLREELDKCLEERNYVDAFYDIADYIRNDTWISRSDVPEGENIANIENKDLEYKNDGYICKKEKDILVEMINAYLNCGE